MVAKCCDECDNHIEKDDCYYQIKIDHMVGNPVQVGHAVRLDLCAPCFKKCGGLLQLSRDTEKEEGCRAGQDEE